jgi:hypothetical protein
MYRIFALTAFLTLFSLPALSEEDDSTLEKAIKLKVVKEVDDDSLLKKSVQLKAAKEISDDDDDSTAAKLVKMKVLKEATKNDD